MTPTSDTRVAHTRFAGATSIVCVCGLARGVFFRSQPPNKIKVGLAHAVQRTLAIVKSIQVVVVVVVFIDRFSASREANLYKHDLHVAGLRLYHSHIWL